MSNVIRKFSFCLDMIFLCHVPSLNGELREKKRQESLVVKVCVRH